jgi:hypothetical protein
LKRDKATGVIIKLIAYAIETQDERPVGVFRRDNGRNYVGRVSDGRCGGERGHGGVGERDMLLAYRPLIYTGRRLSGSV